MSEIKLSFLIEEGLLDVSLHYICFETSILPFLFVLYDIPDLVQVMTNFDSVSPI